jgi:hypothetical protein
MAPQTLCISLVEGEGFETTRPEAVEQVTKSRMIPPELVQRFWRKSPSPSPFEGCLPKPLEFSVAKTLAKQRDFEGDCAPKVTGAQVGWRRE